MLYVRVYMLCDYNGFQVTVKHLIQAFVYLEIRLHFVNFWVEFRNNFFHVIFSEDEFIKRKIYVLQSFC